MNFLRSIPGRNGVPLSYICRDNQESNAYDNTLDFIDNYVLMAPLTGDAFTIDAAEVHTYLTRFMSGNTVAETKMLPNASNANGRSDYMALKDHFEGVGINSVTVLKADEIIRTLFYSGEKKPHMWWDEFERQLTYAFAICEKKEGRVVYSDEMKLRMLTGKINVDFLATMKASINVELTRMPVTMTYQQALTAFRNEVNRKFPPDTTPTRNTRRRLQEVRGRGTGRGQGNNNGRGRGRGRGGRGRGGPQNKHPDERYVTGKDGKTIAVHASYHMNENVWFNLPENERKRIMKECEEYRNSKCQRSLAETQSQVPAEVPTGNPVPRSDVSAVTTGTAAGGTIMGGRNEQQALRSRNTNNH